MPRSEDLAAPSAGPRLVTILPLLLFALVAGVFGWVIHTGRDPAAIPSVMVDKPTPPFTLAPLDAGKPGLSESDLKGHATLVNFFASWCLPCREEHATWTGLAASGGVPIDGIAWKDKPEGARRLLGDLGNPYARVAQDPTGRTGIDFGVYGVPETYIVDGAGRIRYRYAGPVTPEVLQQEILPRLEALGRGK